MFKYCLSLTFILLGIIASHDAVFAAVRVPNDTQYDKQRVYLEQLHLPEAWVHTQGSKETIIAVIDSGVDMDHPDIIRNMWFNKGEKALNGIDDDGNGYIDDLNGWDFVANTPDPHPKFETENPFRVISHGTMAAGIAASTSDNGEGIAGVCWNCKIMALRAIDNQGLHSPSQMVRAIDYATDNGADVISISLGDGPNDDIYKRALRRAYDAGVVVVIATGNIEGTVDEQNGNLNTHPSYPVCYDTGDTENWIIGVGSVDAYNKKTAFSKFGTCVDVVAPGVEVIAPIMYEPQRGEPYTSQYYAGWSGTSISTPMVAGVAGLIRSINPTLTADQVIDIIRSTSTDINVQNSAYTGQLGAGLVNAEAAVLRAQATTGSSSETKPSTVSSTHTFVVGGAVGRAPEVGIYTLDGTLVHSWLAYAPQFTGGFQVGRADVDGDGELEIVTAPGKGGGPHIRIFSETGKLEYQFFAGDPSYRGGLRLSLADLTGDGVAEIFVSPETGDRVNVSIYNYLGTLSGSLKGNEVADLTGGVTISAVDLDGDRIAEFITGSGGGALPSVGVFDTFVRGTDILISDAGGSWLGYPEFFKGSVQVSAGDLTNSGTSEIVTGAGKGGGPQIRIFSQTGEVVNQFFAYEPSFRGGVHVLVGNIDGDDTNEIIVSPLSGHAPEIEIYSLKAGRVVEERSINIFEPSYRGGFHIAI